MTKANLIAPYGGNLVRGTAALVNLVVGAKEREELLARASKLSSIKITMRNLCDLELLATGGFSPLTTFMGKADYERVLHEMRLADGTLWPLPITLTADPKELPTVGEDIVLRSANNDVIPIIATIVLKASRAKGDCFLKPGSSASTASRAGPHAPAG